jgi:hypothetical protein
MDDLLQAIYAIEGIHGCIDDLPPLDYAEPPPMPRPGFGEPRLPFAYLFEGEEAPESDEFGMIYQCDLPITIEVPYAYSRTNAEEGPKRKGRAILAKLQQAVMVDPNRGGRASNTVETFNAVEESAADGVGVVVLKYIVRYARSRLDPDTNVSSL